MLRKPGFWFAVLFIVFALVSLIFYFVGKGQNVFANEQLPGISHAVKGDLNTFLSSSEKAVSRLQRDARNTDVDYISSDTLNKYFARFIGEEDFLVGVVIFGKDMSYVMYREEDSWVTTHNAHADSLVKWTRLNRALEETGSWYDTYNFFMAQQQMDLLRVSGLKPGEHAWRTGLSRNEKNRDLFFNIFLLREEDAEPDHVALMYRTRDLGSKFATLLRFSSPLLTVQTGRGELVTPIRTDDPEKIKQYRILETEVGTAFEKWKAADHHPGFTLSFVEEGTEYWTAIDTLTPLLGVTGFAVTLSQNDLELNKKNVDEAWLYAALLFLIFALALALPVFRKSAESGNVHRTELKPLGEREITEMINQGESEKLEFKSSLRWDYRQQSVNKSLEDVILKSLAAFANASGGILLIGVDDDMNILGLEPDFNTLKKKNVDYFELHIRKLMHNQYGIPFSSQHFLLQFPVINGRTICVIQISRGTTPLYLKTKNNQGHVVEKFYVRAGNASQEITSLKEINEYIKSRFPSGS